MEDLLDAYHLGQYRKAFQEKYEGYRFGAELVTSPWDVVSAVKSMAFEENQILENYWSDAGSNRILKK